jgi:uncharacterized membrane protein
MAEKYNPRLLCQTLFDHSKQLAVIALLFKLGAFAFGALMVLLAATFELLPLVIAAILILAELFQWRSDHIRGVAETILRKLDAYQSFGWQIDTAEMSDVLARTPFSIKKAISGKEPSYEYFSTKEVESPKKALENVRESAWWSKHLAERTGHFYLAVTLILVLGSFLILIVSIETIRNFTVLVNVARVATSVIMLLFSMRLIRLTFDYYNFSRKAHIVENRAEDFLQRKADKVHAIKLMYDYQLARAASPLIPTWIWKSMSTELNELWNLYRQRTNGSEK